MMFDLEDAFSTKPITELAREQAQKHNRDLARMTEDFLRKAVAQGANVDVWRGGPFTEPGSFSIAYEFQLVRRGSEPELRTPGVMFRQPELTEGERARLLAGRSDWREDQWEDCCGLPRCEHCPCDGGGS